MADLTITAANVISGPGSSTENGKAGESITAGQTVYKGSNGKYMKADSNSGTAAAKTARGIALNGAADGQPLAIQKAGPITIGATLTPGASYYLSDTAGGICPDADVGSGENVCLLGIAASASVLNIDIQAPGVTR